MSATKSPAVAVAPPVGRARSDSFGAISRDGLPRAPRPSDAPSDIQVSFYMLLTRLDKLSVPGAELDANSAGGATQASERKRKKEVLANLEAILGAFIEQKRSAFVVTRTWAEIFHQRMIHNRDLLTPEQLDHWCELFAYFIKKGGNSSIQAANLMAVAQELLIHLRTHRQDVDNSIIGMQVHHKVRPGASAHSSVSLRTVFHTLALHARPTSQTR